MKTAIIAIALSAALASSVQAQIIVPQVLTDINFSGANSSFSGPAVIGTTGDYWNFLGSTPPAGGSGSYDGNLLGTDGLTYTTFSINWSGGNFPYAPGTPLWPNSPTPGITEGFTTTNNVTQYQLSGFDPSETYSFDFLTANDTTGRATKITLTGAAVESGIATMNKADTTWINGNEYIQFNNVAPDPAAGTFSFVLATGPGSPEGDLNGIQIFQNIQQAPEPGTYGLVGMGLAVLFVVRRCRRLTEV